MVITSLKADWRPILRLPESIPSTSFLTDESFLEQYNAIVDSSFKGNKILKVLSRNGGSNPFAVALVGEMVKPAGYSVVTPAQLEQVRETNTLPLRGQYVDTGLVLRSEDNPNSYLARNLAEQVRARGKELRNPLLIPLASIRVVNDQHSDYGLAFKLNEDAEIIEAPILTSENGSYIYSGQMDQSTGLPTAVFPKADSTYRQLWTRKSGLSRLYLGGGLDIYSDGEDLAGSFGGGRVVLVSGGATDANAIRTLYEQKKNELSLRLQKATEHLDVGYKAALKELN